MKISIGNSELELGGRRKEEEEEEEEEHAVESDNSGTRVSRVLLRWRILMVASGVSLRTS